MYQSDKPYKKEIRRLAELTWETPYVSVKNWITTEKFSCPTRYYHTDGTGTKAEEYWKRRSFRGVVVDALTMNTNDMLMQWAIPFCVNDHILIHHEDQPAIVEIVEHLVDECVLRKLAITGGETSIQHNIEGLELSITMAGFVPRPWNNQLMIGDVLVGIASNGIHSNGFTKLWELGLLEKYREAVTYPTRDYCDCVWKLRDTCRIHGMMHITGGAFTKLQDILPPDADVLIRGDHTLDPQSLFREVHALGVRDEEMYKIFNCGVGFVLGVKQEDASACLRNIAQFRADSIGNVVNGSGKVIINSKFSKKLVAY